MSRLAGTQVLATAQAQVKRAAVATTATATAAATADLTAVVDYATSAKRTKLVATVDIAQLTTNEIETDDTGGKDDIVIMTDTAAAAATDTQKRANFSALTVGNPNGVNKISPNLANAKPGSAKKLVIKNFKSKQANDWAHERSSPDLTSKSVAELSVDMLRFCSLVLTFFPFVSRRDYDL